MTEAASGAREAATLVIFRDRVGGASELLMMERSQGMAFAGGALVFPGGGIEPQDLLLAEALVQASASILPVDEVAARIAAIRETLEESGLAIGFLDPPDRFSLGAMRADMAAGASFAKLATAKGLRLDLDALVPFARWQPGFKENARRVYDTRFYLARLPEGSHAPSVDATENVHLIWASAQEVLDRADRGEVKIIFPTRRNLERLAQFRDFDAAADHARTLPVRKITPWIEARADGHYLCIGDCHGYPVTAESLDTVMRG